jgi:hypothetical protein
VPFEQKIRPGGLILGHDSFGLLKQSLTSAMGFFIARVDGTVVSRVMDEEHSNIHLSAAAGILMY